MLVAKNSIQAPRGTRDFYPEEMRQRTWLFENFRRVAGKFGFEEVDAPILEHAELFTRKAGEEIVDQLYHFELHDRHLALRPEMTPSVARMVMARAGGLKLPLRWFTVTQNWRYERMTRGRLREHYQWNMDIWGEAGVTAEAELVAALLTLVRELGLPAGTVKVRINSRALLEESLRQGVLAERPEAFAPLCVIIDKLDKIGEEAVRDMLCAAEGSIGLQPAEAESVLQMLRARNLDEAAEAGGEGSAALRDLKRLFELLEAYGVADDVIFDASVVRGLAYYTGIVFEAFDAQGELRAICGGGRYDRLLETLGGKSIPAVGFGFGDVVITELLKDQNLLPEPTQELDDIVFAFSEAEQIAAAQLATQLRAEGRQVELILGKMKPKRVFADAAAKGASRVFLIGPDDLAAGKAAVKELSTGEQKDWPLYPK